MFNINAVCHGLHALITSINACEYQFMAQIMPLKIKIKLVFDTVQYCKHEKKLQNSKREKFLISLRGENFSQVLITSPQTYKIRPLLSIFYGIVQCKVRTCSDESQHTEVIHILTFSEHNWKVPVLHSCEPQEEYSRSLEYQAEKTDML